MLIFSKRTILAACLSLLFVGLLSNCDNEPDTPKEDSPKRTVLIYMAADNNLSDFSAANINNALIGAAGDNLNGGNLLIYVDPANNVPQLIRIAKNKQGVVEKQVVKTYAEHNSASPEIMQAVIDDVLSDRTYKADSYGLILWSHGTAWLPYDINNYLRSFGDDHGSALTMDDLKRAIPDHLFDFILFDACYMSSIEVAYALKDKAKYILGSPTEILAEGMPYRFIIQDLFSDEALSVLLTNVGHRFYTYYNEQQGGTHTASATVSLLKTEHLPQMAAVCREILRGKEESLLDLPLQEIQQMDYLKQNPPHLLYDFDDYIVRVASAEQYAHYAAVLAELIPYKEATKTAFYAIGITLPINRFSGLSVYAPQTALPKLNAWYKTQDWYQAVYE